MATVKVTTTKKHPEGKGVDKLMDYEIAKSLSDKGLVEVDESSKKLSVTELKAAKKREDDEKLKKQAEIDKGDIKSLSKEIDNINGKLNNLSDKYEELLETVTVLKDIIDKLTPTQK